MITRIWNSLFTLWSCSPVPEGASKLKSNKPEGAQKYSIVTYLVLLFAVVIALVLLSYFVQQRRDSSDMDDFRQEHLSRLDQIELRLEDEEAAVAALEGRIAVLETEQAALEKDLEAAKTGESKDITALKEKIEALHGEIDAVREEMEPIMEKYGN